MRSGKEIRLWGTLAAIAASALLLAGCNDSTPTEPRLTAAGTPAPVPTATPTAAPANIDGEWMGPFEGQGPCGTGATAKFLQSGATFRGSLRTSGSCYWDFYDGRISGNTLEASTVDADGFQGAMQAVLSDSALELTVVDFFGTTRAHLHRQVPPARPFRTPR